MRHTALALNRPVTTVMVFLAVLAVGLISAKLLRLDRTLRLKVLPILVAPPWGLTVGDFLPRLPLPAKITIDVLPAINLRERFGPDPDVDEVYEHVTAVMQDGLSALAAERRFPVIG